MQQRGTVLALAAVFAAAACGDKDTTPPGTVTSVAITGAPTGSIAVTRTANLTATAVVTNGASTAVTWTSSNTAVATLAATGTTATVTAVGAGTSTITAASAFDPTKTGTATITVVPNILKFAATMNPANEPPGLAGNPTGSGSLTASLDTITNILTWSGTFAGLTSNVNNGHIHGPFPNAAATTAGVVVNFNPAGAQTGATNLVFTNFGTGTSGTISGGIPLTSALVISATVSGDSVRKMIINGNSYVNIHTTTNAGGEIRGQLTRVP